MGKRRIIEGNSQEARKMRRQELGPLKSLIIKPATLERYRRAADHFFAHLRRQREPIPQTPEIMDIVLSEYIGELWEEGHSKSLAGDTISGLQHHQPSLKGELKTSWRYLKAWQQAEVPARAPPFSLQTLAIFCGWAHQQNPHWALALQLGFHALLRTGELLQLQAKDCTVQQDHIHLFLGQTKTSFRNANVDSVHFRHHQLALLLDAWKNSVRKNGYLVDCSNTAFRTWFARGLRDTSLDHIGYKPYSLRRGGATHVFTESHSYSTVTQQGRWSSQQTVRVYIADSLALLNDLNLRLSPIHFTCLRQWNAVLRELELSARRRNGERG